MVLLEWNPGGAGQGSLGCALLSPGCEWHWFPVCKPLYTIPNLLQRMLEHLLSEYEPHYTKKLQINWWRRCINFLFCKITGFGCCWSWLCSFRVCIFSLLKNFFLPGSLAKWLKCLHKYFQAQTSSKVYFRLRSSMFLCTFATTSLLFLFLCFYPAKWYWGGHSALSLCEDFISK